MKIPLVDLKAQYFSIKNEVDTAIKSVIEETAFVGGPSNKYNQEFERSFADYTGTKHCISCANGTDALEIILKAYNIGYGDEVIAPALTWISTSESVSNCGATPVFVDIDPKLYTIDPNKIKTAINQKTKAIIPVHLYGLPAQIDEIIEIAKKHKLLVIEDSAQAHGAEYNGTKVGTFGDAATFSFFPAKNLGAYGDAGGILTNNNAIATKARMIANHGMVERHKHEFEGRNSRMDGLQAAILSVKLKHLDKWNRNRIYNAKLYNKYLNNSIVRQICPNNMKHVYHLYVIQSKNRDLLKEKLKEVGIDASIHYPMALPFLEAYQNRGFDSQDFPVAYNVTNKILSLPMYPEMTEEQIKYVADVVNKIEVFES